jgi:DNA-binding transcriptional MerR regulator
MKLTPGQLRELLGLTQDAFRHWKRALAPLKDRNGYRPCFTPGDLLAVAVVKALTEDAGVRVGALSSIAEELFRVCNEASWPALERSTLLLDLSEQGITVLAETQPVRAAGTAIYVACRPIVARLRERVLSEGGVEPQQILHFPPTVVGAGVRSAGGEQE